MSPPWESGHPTEDEWWSDLYGAPPPAGPPSPHDAPPPPAAPGTPPPPGPAAPPAPPRRAYGAPPRMPAVPPLPPSLRKTPPPPAAPEPATPPPPRPSRAPTAPPAAAPPPAPAQAGPPAPPRIPPAHLPRPAAPALPPVPPPAAPGDDALGRHFAAALRVTGDPDPARPYAPARPPEPPADVPPPALPDGWAQVATAHVPPPRHTGELWPATDPERLADRVPDTVLEGARYGRLTVRAVAARGDDARLHGRERRDALLTVRFGEGDDSVLLLALAAAPEGHARGAAVLRALGQAVGTHRAALLADLRSRDAPALRAGLRRITERVRIAGTRCPVSAALLPAGPAPAARVYFGAGTGAPLRLREGVWRAASPVPPTERGFRLLLDDARPGDVTLLCGDTVGAVLDAAPRVAARLAARWAPPAEPPGAAAFLADLTTPVPGLGGDRTAVAVWDAPGPG